MLDCSHNKLSSLNLNGLINLSIVCCDSNYLSSLKLTGCSNLQVLSCFNNYLTKLDFLNDLSSRKLRELLIGNNKFINDDSKRIDNNKFNHFAGSTEALKNLLHIENTIEPNDYRVSEVRLFKEMEKVGEDFADNLVICGDSLNALTSLSKIPEYRKKYVNKIKLIYIDPPFNTGQITDQNYILVFAKNIEQFKINRLPRTEKQNKLYKNPDNDLRGLWRTDNFSVKAINPKNVYPITTPSGKIVYPPKGLSWLVSPERLEELIKDNRIWWGKSGSNVPALKRFLNEEVGHNDEAKKEIKRLFPEIDPFETPKPERLLKRIIQIATNEGDIVLDYFAGSGTTAANNENTINNFAVPRLKKVISGEDKGGISEEVN
ncbi:8206_t:CDS:2 [Racocetra fulgida]|uniref:8206_t:CDS:1 n=1 Tax=Racocetra fulgida TaxID=60492 RepID=A0A9N8W0Q6_9GLOM|nr:8206_t:CDS:2 [Racocetra fulgida]